MEAMTSHIELENLLKNSSAMESEEMKELVEGLIVAVEDEEQRREILEKKGEDAQHWLDVLQLLADSPDISSSLRSTILTIMVRLSKNSGRFPKCLVIQNVKKQGEHPVGGGGFGDVWKGIIDHVGSTQTVCLKVVKVYLTSDVRRSLAEYLREAIVWKQLDHPNILPFLGIYYLDDTRQRICLVSPWMERGNLVEYLKDTPRESVDHLALVLDIASGLSHLHVKKIVHADLKGVNVLITPSGSACICDFGLARIADSQVAGISSSTSRSTGTLRWMAPELLAENVTATKESDLYAFACVCYEILTGLIPFHKCKNDGAVIIQVSLGKRPSRPENLPKSLEVVWNTMELCWQADPFLRPSASTILRELKPTVTPIDPALLTLQSRSYPDTPQSSSTPVSSLRSSASTVSQGHVAVARPADTSLVRSVLADPYQPNSQRDPSSHRSAATSRAARHQSPSPQRGIPLPASPHHPPRSSLQHSPKSPTPRLDTSISESSSRTSPPPPSPSDLESAASSDSDDLGNGHWQKIPNHIANRRYVNPSPVRLTAFKWVRGELVGRGTYGRAYLALNTTTGEMMVVKQVDLPQTRNERGDTRLEAVLEAFKLESETLRDLDHPNIMQYLGYEETPTNLNMFLEYVPGGSVGSVLLKHGKLSEPITISFSAQILTGLEYLHSKGILHRDLKANNIFVQLDGVCKISGFSVSKHITKRGRAYTAMRGSVFWMAPEVIAPPINLGYDFKVDIWSFGCVVLEMLTGTRPWSGVADFPAMFKVSQEKTPPPIPEGVVLSELAVDFLRRKCFAGDPDERPTAAELRRHRYLELPPGWKFSGLP
ncbi:MAP kinase kinase kinase activity protein [Marasmius sp. AFHP31]|nr:MAP kinase kinase kinase activity protein [Marasmius sp. AFHP31]